MSIKLLVLILIFGTQNLLAKELIIVSDLDETLRMANAEKVVRAGLKLISGVKPYEGLKSIFKEIKSKNPEAKFYYLSNSYAFTYSGKKWISKNGLPKGTVYQRHLGDQSDHFKPNKFKRDYKRHPDAAFLFFGDNVEQDPKFYQELLSQSNIEAQVYIRDARLIFPDGSDLNYYQTEAQTTDDLNMSKETTASIRDLALKQVVPFYLLRNLKKRITRSCIDYKEDCREAARIKVQEVIDLIHHNHSF